MDVHCDTCPIRFCCDTYAKEKRDNEYSYHRMDEIMAFKSDCPLMKLMPIKEDK